MALALLSVLAAALARLPKAATVNCESVYQFHQSYIHTDKAGPMTTSDTVVIGLGLGLYLTLTLNPNPNPVDHVV